MDNLIIHERAPVARPDLRRLAMLRNSLLDLDIVADDERRVLLEALARYQAAVAERDQVAADLAAAIAVAIGGGT